MSSETPKLSIVTTACNEAGNVVGFLGGALSAIGELGVSAEIIYIDDGSSDGTSDAVGSFLASQPNASIRLVRHSVQQGITAALQESMSLVRGELICYLPADLESSPGDDIPILYRSMDNDTDVVVGRRQNRGDGKSLSSNAYNVLNRWLFGVRVHDANWIKLVRRQKLDGITLRADWHRFLVAILVHRGCRVKEVETQWHRRTYGRSKFGWRRVGPSIASMLALKAVLTFGGNSLLFFQRCAEFAVAAALGALVVALLAGRFLGLIIGIAVAFLLIIGIAVAFLRKPPYSMPKS